MADRFGSGAGSGEGLCAFSGTRRLRRFAPLPRKIDAGLSRIARHEVRRGHQRLHGSGPHDLSLCRADRLRTGRGHRQCPAHPSRLDGRPGDQPPPRGERTRHHPRGVARIRRRRRCAPHAARHGGRHPPHHGQNAGLVLPTLVCAVAGHDRGRGRPRPGRDGAPHPRTLLVAPGTQGPRLPPLSAHVRPRHTGGRSPRFALRPHADRGDDSPSGHHGPHAGRCRGEGPRRAAGRCRCGPAARTGNPFVGLGHVVPERQEPLHGDGRRS